MAYRYDRVTCLVVSEVPVWQWLISEIYWCGSLMYNNDWFAFVVITVLSVWQRLTTFSSIDWLIGGKDEQAIEGIIQNDVRLNPQVVQ